LRAQRKNPPSFPVFWRLRRMYAGAPHKPTEPALCLLRMTFHELCRDNDVGDGRNPIDSASAEIRSDPFPPASSVPGAACGSTADSGTARGQRCRAAVWIGARKASCCESGVVIPGWGGGQGRGAGSRKGIGSRLADRRAAVPGWRLHGLGRTRKGSPSPNLRALLSLYRLAA
jgi:hypothetical protein